MRANPIFHLMVLLILSTTSFSLFAKTIDCTSSHVKYKNALVLLNVNEKKLLKNKVYYIQNISDHSIWLNHPQDKNPHAGAGWSTLLKPENGSALLLSKKNFSLNCSQVKPDKIHFFDCREVVRICESNVKVITQEAQNYWLAENITWEKLPKAVSERLSHQLSD